MQNLNWSGEGDRFEQVTIPSFMKVRFSVIFVLSCVALLALLFVLVNDVPSEAVIMCAGCVGH